MLLLYKPLVLYRLDYEGQLSCPYKTKDIERGTHSDRNGSLCKEWHAGSKLDMFLKTIENIPGVPNRSDFPFDLIK